ncbi:MAG: hypothetical protein LBS96_05335 [Oscillospiraceae bacterium]|jgi:hypothetical protein|nr:hypothetical protein [Oscillospiraceae bacterium]
MPNKQKNRLIVPTVCVLAGLIAVVAVFGYLMFFSLNAQSQKSVEALAAGDRSALAVCAAFDGEESAVAIVEDYQIQGSGNAGVKILGSETTSGEELKELLRLSDPGDAKAHLGYDWGKIEAVARVDAKITRKGETDTTEENVTVYMISEGVRWYLALNSAEFGRNLTALRSIEALAEHSLEGISLCEGYDLERAFNEDAALHARIKAQYSFEGDSYEAFSAAYDAKHKTPLKETLGTNVQATIKVKSITPVSADALSIPAGEQRYLSFDPGMLTGAVEVKAEITLTGDKLDENKNNITAKEERTIYLLAQGTQWYLLPDIGQYLGLTGEESVQ